MIPVVVIGAAPVPGADAFYASLLAEARHVVAADGGAEVCRRAGRVPDVVVGDLDSGPSDVLEWARAGGAEVVVHPMEKDATDLELAVAEARARFGGPVTISAAFSGRLDHTLAAVGTLARAGGGANAREPGWSARVVSLGDPLALELPDGVAFSVISLGEAIGVTVSGARWPLADAVLPPLAGLGVSNVTSGKMMRVSVEQGTLVVYIPDCRAASGLNAASRAGGGPACAR